MNNFTDTLLAAVEKATSKVEQGIYKDWARFTTKEAREKCHSELLVLKRFKTKLIKEINNG